MNDVIRLPYIQDVPGRLATQFQTSLMHTDALRRVKTTAKNRIATGPLSTPQMFVTEPSGGVNTPGSMAAGAQKMNARRLVAKTPGQSAGIE
ncbi:MAG TPA: hypothetical protein VG371_17460 [Solirubrobacteraceae bacterium]|jgi:hypothetical protein|nr:hypothetical protein [Solirubrobacteraceae bacterium]